MVYMPHGEVSPYLLNSKYDTNIWVAEAKSFVVRKALKEKKHSRRPMVLLKVCETA
jgi:hypothetical protein